MPLLYDEVMVRQNLNIEKLSIAEMKAMFLQDLMQADIEDYIVIHTVLTSIFTSDYISSEIENGHIVINDKTVSDASIELAVCNEDIHIFYTQHALSVVITEWTIEEVEELSKGIEKLLV